MDTQDNWQSILVEAIRKECPMITDVLAQAVLSLLKGDFNERRIPTAEMARIAQQLLDQMEPAPASQEPQP